MAEAKVAFGATPRKSSCTFCGAMKAVEVVMLAEDHPELLARALFMEQVALLGRHKPRRPRQGLNQGVKWTDFAAGDVERVLPAEVWAVYLAGGVLRNYPKTRRAPKRLFGSTGVLSEDGRTYVAYIPPGETRPIRLKPNEEYIPQVRIPGLPPGQLLPLKVIRKLTALAKEYVKHAPDRGRKVGGKLQNHLKGQLDKDFRPTGELDYETMEDKLLPEARAEGHQLNVRKLQALIRRVKRSKGCRRRSANPPPINAPEWEGGVPRNPFLSGF
jgi:hypothetical protein